MPLRWFVESGTDDFSSADLPLPVGYFFRSFIDEENDKMYFRVVLLDRLCNRLQQHGLSGPGRRYDESALTLSDWGDKVHDPHSKIGRRMFEVELLRGIVRSQVVE